MNFTIVSCGYNGSAGGNGESNSLCWIAGNVNGKSVYPSVFLGYLKTASAAGKMQEALTPIMWNWYVQVWGRLLTPWPNEIPILQFSIPTPTFIVERSTAPNVTVSVLETLIGSWPT
jgi:hypothetical protein